MLTEKKGKAKRKNGLIIFLFLLPALIIFIVVFAWPFVLTIYSSFTNWDGVSPMEFIGLKNYQKLFKDRDFNAALWNTCKSALWAIFVHVPFGVLIALTLSKKLRGWKLVRSTFMLPSMIATSTYAMLFIYMFRLDSGLVNSIAVSLFGPQANINYINDANYTFNALTMMWVWYAGVLTLIVLSEIMSISPELYEAAKVDGANEFQIDLYINLPLLTRIIATTFIMAITSVFKQFDLIFLSTKGGPSSATLNLALMSYKKMIFDFKYGWSNAIGVVLMLLGIIVMAGILFLSKKLGSEKPSKGER